MTNVFRVAVIATFMTAAAASAQENPRVKTTQLAERIYLLTSDQGSYTTNSLVSVGSDGVLLVDTQSEEDVADLKTVVDGFGKGAPVYIINTHRHIEHISGNALWGDAPVVIAHDLMPAKLRSRAMIFMEFPRATFPDITFSDSLSLYFNGERISLVAIPGSHDDNEIMVHFTDSKVAHISSLANGFNFPSVDQDGNVLKFPECVARALALLPNDVQIVSGHNRVGSWDDLSKYHEMLVKTIEIVRGGVAEGKTAETLKQEKVLAAYESYAGSYVSSDDWIDYLVSGPGTSQAASEKKQVFEPLFDAWKEKGAKAAADLFRQFSQDENSGYACGDADLLVIGDKLLARKLYADAVEFLAVGLELYPNADYAFYTAYELAKCHQELGNKTAAIECCRKALALKADYEPARKLLEELEK